VGGPDYPDVMMRALRLKGQLPELVDPAMQIGFTLDDFTQTEFWWLRRGLRWVSGGTAAAVAGQQGFLTLGLGPGLIGIVDAIVVGAAVNTRFGVVPAGGGLSGGANVGVFAQDSRMSSGTVTSTVVQIGANAAAIPGGAFLFNCPANQSVIIPVKSVLVGNAALLAIQSGTANQAVDFAIAWHERPVFQEEL
jgi:hypothetical protein